MKEIMIGFLGVLLIVILVHVFIPSKIIGYIVCFGTGTIWGYIWSKFINRR